MLPRSAKRAPVCAAVDPREGDDLGHAVFVAGEPGHLFEAMVQHPRQALHLTGIALDRGRMRLITSIRKPAARAIATAS